MSKPLISSELAGTAGAGPILAISQRQQTVRDTAAHAHASGQLIGSMAGLLSVTVPTGSWIVPATHAIWMPPHVPHALRSHGAFAGWSVYVEEAACAALPLTARTLRVSGLLREAVHRAASWQRAPDSAAEHRLAAVVLDEIAALPAEPLGLPRPRDARAARVAEAILADLTDRRTVDDFAKWAGIAPRTLARRFADETGFGLMVWRQRACALRAVEMLADGMAVTTIAIDLGYDNVSAFIAMFRRIMGTTPGRYADL